MFKNALSIFVFMFWLLFTATVPAMEKPALEDRDVAGYGSGALQGNAIAINEYNARWYAAKTGWSGYDFFLRHPRERRQGMVRSIGDGRLSNSLGMEFVYIKPGTFMRGRAAGDPGFKGDENQHWVTLTEGYYMQTTEVTQGQWRAVMGTNPSYFKRCGDDCPVENVSWNDIMVFIDKLNYREGGGRYRLPTEAQWEYAARAGGETFDGEGRSLDDVAWYYGNSGKRPHPVARKSANAWGLYDMYGNVWEWCQDWKGAYPSGHVTDPAGPEKGWGRVFRGGSWYSVSGFCTSASRSSASPNAWYDGLGFRLVMSPGGVD